MAELVDALDSGSSVRKDVRVQVSPSAHNCNFFALNTYFFLRLCFIDKHKVWIFSKNIMGFIFLFHSSPSYFLRKKLNHKKVIQKRVMNLLENLQSLDQLLPQTTPSGAIESNPLVLLVRSGSVSLSDALSLGLAGCLELQSSLGKLMLSDDIFAAALAVRGLDFYDNSKHQTALTEAAILANNLLIDRSISSTADLPSSISVDSFNQDGYNVAFISSFKIWCNWFKW